jgi:hypothetical protein
MDSTGSVAEKGIKFNNNEYLDIDAFTLSVEKVT